MKIMYVIWYKNGFWYCANVNTMKTSCYSSLDNATCLQGMECLKYEGGAYFYGHLGQED